MLCRWQHEGENMRRAKVHRIGELKGSKSFLTRDGGRVYAGEVRLEHVHAHRQISRVPSVQAGADDGDGVVLGLLLVPRS